MGVTRPHGGPQGLQTTDDRLTFFRSFQTGLRCLCSLYVGEFVARERGRGLHPLLDGDAPVRLALRPGSVSADCVNGQVVQPGIVAVSLEGVWS